VNILFDMAQSLSSLHQRIDDLLPSLRDIPTRPRVSPESVWCCLMRTECLPIERSWPNYKTGHRCGLSVSTNMPILSKEVANDMMRSEQLSLALTSLKSLLSEQQMIKDGERLGVDDQGYGACWPAHYRQLEAHNDVLPGMLHKCLQKWTQQDTDERNIHYPILLQANKDLRRPLHFCSALGFEVLGKMYLQMGHNPNLPAYPDGQSALHLAAAGGHTGMVEMLLDRGADIELKTVNTGRTPLQLAAFRGHEEVIKSLLREGANYEARDKFGHTTLDLASLSGYGEVVDLLLPAKLSKMALWKEDMNSSPTVHQGHFDSYNTPRRAHSTCADRCQSTMSSSSQPSTRDIMASDEVDLPQLPDADLDPIVIGVDLGLTFTGMCAKAVSERGESRRRARAQRREEF
jgi:hypothetical protein